MRHVLKVPDISCGHCKMRISRALEELGIRDYEVDLAGKRVELEAEDVNLVLKKLESIGYPAFKEG